MNYSQYCDTESTHSGDVDTFCNNVLKELEKIPPDISLLRQVCGQVCCCKSILNTSELLDILLGFFNEKIMNYYNNNSLEFSLLIENIFQNVKYHPRATNMLEKCVDFFLNNLKTDNAYIFLVRFWNSSYIDESFQLKLIEIYINKLPRCIEDDIVSITEDILNTKTVNENAWKQQRIVRLIKWCSLSRNIFFITTSILNQFIFQMMLYTKHFTSCLSLVSNFLLKVRESCDLEAQDFKLLYPHHIQPLILILELDPNMLSDCGHKLLQSTISKLIEHFKNEPLRTLSLLTHFPKWTLFLYKFVTYNNIS